MKTFSVNHIEDNGEGADYYYNGDILAEDLDKAIEEFKNEWLNKEIDKNDIMVTQSDEDMEILEIDTEWFKDGELLTDKEIEELESKYQMDISDMIDNFDLGFEISYLTHSYEIKEESD